MAIRNGLYASPNKTRIFNLKGDGWSNAEIAEWLNEVEGITGPAEYTENQVHEYFTRALTTSSASKLISMNRGKDLAKYQAEADEFFEYCKREFQAAIATGDLRRFEAASKQAKAWFDGRLLVNGIGGAPGTVNFTQNNYGPTREDAEKDGMVKAVKEFLADNPGMWEKIRLRAMAIADGAMSVDGAISTEGVIKDAALGGSNER